MVQLKFLGNTVTQWQWKLPTDKFPCTIVLFLCLQRLSSLCLPLPVSWKAISFFTNFLCLFLTVLTYPLIRMRFYFIFSDLSKIPLTLPPANTLHKRVTCFMHFRPKLLFSQIFIFLNLSLSITPVQLTSRKKKSWYFMSIFLGH